MSLISKGLKDSDIISQASLGNKGAYRELLRKYSNLSLAVALARSGNRDKARAAAADAFVEGAKELGQIPESAPISPWIASLTRATAAKRMGGTRRPSLTTEAAEEKIKNAIEEADESEPMTAEKKSELSLLAFGALSDDEREALCLLHLYSNKYDEIAAAMTTEASRIDENLASARNKLAIILGPLFGK